MKGSWTPGKTNHAELRFNLSNHSEGGEGAFRDFQGVHRADLFLPVPPEASRNIAEFAGLAVRVTDFPALVVREVCDHNHLASYSFLSTVTGRIPEKFRFADNWETTPTLSKPK